MTILIPIGVLIISLMFSLDFFQWRRKQKLLDEKRAKHLHELEIKDRIDRWQALQPDMELHEYLGMTLEQYERWLHDPGSLLK